MNAEVNLTVEETGEGDEEIATEPGTSEDSKLQWWERGCRIHFEFDDASKEKGKKKSREPVRAKCKHCAVKIRGCNTVTSHFMNHLQSSHLHLYEDLKKQRKLAETDKKNEKALKRKGVVPESASDKTKQTRLELYASKRGQHDGLFDIRNQVRILKNK